MLVDQYGHPLLADPPAAIVGAARGVRLDHLTQKSPLTSPVGPYPSVANSDVTAWGSGGVVRNARQLRAWADSSPYIRAAIRRRKVQIGAAEWDIVPENPAKPFDATLQARIRDRLERPNPTNDSFRAIMEQVVEDLLVLDQGVLEKELAVNGETVALWPVDGGRIVFNPRWRGDDPAEPRYFYQPPLGRAKVPLRNDQLIVMQENQRTHELRGLSAVETLAQTIEALTVSADFQVQMAKQYPPAGFVFIPNMEEPQLQNVQERYLTEAAGAKALFFMTYQTATGGSGGDGKPQYVPLLYNAETMQWEQWQEFLVRQVAITFGLSPQDLGLERDVNRSTSEVQQENTADTGLKPLLLLVQSYLNREYLPTFRGYARGNLQFVYTALNAQDERANADLSKTLLAGMPQITINEGRAMNGLDPVPGGDAIFAMTAHGPVPFLGEDAVVAQAEGIDAGEDAGPTPGAADDAKDAPPDAAGGPPDREEAYALPDPALTPLAAIGQQRLLRWLEAATPSYLTRMADYLDAAPDDMPFPERLVGAARFAAGQMCENRPDLTRDLYHLGQATAAHALNAELTTRGQPAIAGIGQASLLTLLLLRAERVADDAIVAYAGALAAAIPADAPDPYRALAAIAEWDATNRAAFAQRFAATEVHAVTDATRREFRVRNAGMVDGQLARWTGV